MKILRHRFFYILDNCSTVQSNFYGFVVTNDELCINCSNLTDYELEKQLYYGSYICIKRCENTVRLYQDFHGSYGLYIFKKENYWAISNSFLFLLNFLIGKTKLSCNENYLKAWAVTPLSTWSYAETAV